MAYLLKYKKANVANLIILILLVNLEIGSYILKEYLIYKGNIANIASGDAMGKCLIRHHIFRKTVSLALAAAFSVFSVFAEISLRGG